MLGYRAIRGVGESDERPPLEEAGRQRPSYLRTHPKDSDVAATTHRENVSTITCALNTYMNVLLLT